jgi:hypothetical protein
VRGKQNPAAAYAESFRWPFHEIVDVVQLYRSLGSAHRTRRRAEKPFETRIRRSTSCSPSRGLSPATVLLTLSAAKSHRAGPRRSGRHAEAARPRRLAAAFARPTLSRRREPSRPTRTISEWFVAAPIPRLVMVRAGSSLRRRTNARRRSCLLPRANASGLSARQTLSIPGGTFRRHRGTAVAARLDSDGHGAQSIEQSRFRADRPPVVQEDFHRAPHGHPAADHEAFAQQVGDCMAAKRELDEMTAEQRQREDCQPNQQALASDAEQLARGRLDACAR